MSSKQIQHILELTLQERKDFVDSFDCVICDCDGVLWTVFEPIAGIADALATLRAHGKTIRYITNNSVRSFESYVTQFQSLGVTLEPSDLIHPAVSVVRYLKSTNFEGLIYCIATETFKSILREAGFELLDGPSDPLEESFKKIIATVHDRSPVRAVIVDVDFNLNYPKLLRAELYLKNDPNCLLIAGATDKLLHAKRDFDLIGPGYFSEVLEHATGKKAIVLGKPGVPLVEQVLEAYAIAKPQRVLFVGDMLGQDIAFGSCCGFQKLLVLSGGTTREEMMQQTDPAWVPDYYADSLADFVQLFQ
ncbi:uncharacterized protein LOC131682228 [Topomyia yanbarensis]|uniref:uncharacterized protein LOC131682228 n=1 Tax=Topomyia yanbarensis TaxID=2498891 RepID=UPI00273CACDF|nr:uncharacterized protein LOC131682228 [Topomyia yanbarensis]